MEFEVGDRVMLKVLTLEKGSYGSVNRAKLIRDMSDLSELSKSWERVFIFLPFRLELPQELAAKEIHVDDKLQFMEEPIEIMEREIKRLKRSRIPLVKVRWNSRRGPEFTWEREDSFKKK
ncbi:hypothetical protein Tco_0491082 [Tanacetum coccineum]